MIFSRVFRRDGGGSGLLPEGGIEKGPVLRRKAAVKPGGAVQRGERRLNGDGSAAAEGIAEVALPAIAGELYHGGGQRLAQGGLGMSRTVAALVQRGAGGVKVERGLILPNRETDLVLCTAFGKMLQMVTGLQAFHDGFFDDALTVRDREQRGIQTVAGNGEGRVPGQDILPRKGAGAFKERVKGHGGKRPDFHQHALAAAQGEVYRGTVGETADEKHTSVLGADLGEVHAPKFIGNKPFDAEETGNRILKLQMIVHNKSSHFGVV